MRTKNKISLIQFIVIGFVMLFSISCRKDNEANNMIVDIDGNVYHSVTIGTQVWMVENLKTTRYNDGTLISNITVDNEWFNYTSGAFCNYDNDENNVEKYGRLYNWYAVETGKLAPKGWHIPTDAEWEILIDYLKTNGYSYDGTVTDNRVGKSLASTSGWAFSDEPGDVGNDQATNNSTGFTALPSGYRSVGGVFCFIDEYTKWWSSTSYSESMACYRDIGYGYGHVIWYYTYKSLGFSVRCIKD